MLDDGTADEFGKRHAGSLCGLLHLRAKPARHAGANDIGKLSPTIIELD